VVIAIIGMLSSVILGALNSTRAKAANAAVKSNMTNMRSQIALLFDNGPYTNICTNPTITAFRTAAATAGGGTNVCNVGGGTTPTSFVISIQLKVQEGAYNYWCVDSTGFMGGHNAVISGTATACPAS